MATFITDVGALVTGSVSWITSGVSAITSNPLLTFFVLFGFMGAGIGLVKRVIS